MLLLWFELICFLGCLINFRKLSGTMLAWFLPLLMLTVVVEWGSYFHWFTLTLSDGHRSSNWVYNLFNQLEFGFYGWLYYRLVHGVTEKKVIQYGFLIYLLGTLINVLFIQGPWYLDTYSYILGCCYVMMCVYIYFNQLMNNVEDEPMLKNPLFWVSIGALFFYVGDAFLMGFFQYFLSINDFEAFRPVFRFFSALLNILLYSCLTIAFFCPPLPKRNPPATLLPAS